MRKEVKSWEECKQEEKEELLRHWFMYYGTIVTLEDIEKFGEIIKTKADKVFDSLIPLYITRNTIQSSLLVSSMREGKVEELLSSSAPDELTPEIEEAIKNIRRILFEEIKNTFFNPKPPVPMDVIIGIKKNKKS